jgi:acyl-coenzyme A synthetase/AMP-(fatty) acid ligase
MNDVGFQPEPGKLVVLGRADDMLNIGGEKISPYPIESALNAIDCTSSEVLRQSLRSNF